MKKFLILALALTLAVAALPVSSLAELDTGEVISRTASLRSSPSTSAQLLVSIKNGESFTIIGENEDWYQANFTSPSNGQSYSGWIRKRYVVENPKHLVARNSGNLYASPSITDKMVGSFSRYDKFTVIDETSRYYLVSCRNAAAFIPRSGDYWTDEDLEFLNNRLYVCTATQKTALYLTASTRSKVVNVSSGTQFDVVGYEGDYAIVKYKTAFAYIPMAHIQ